MSPRSCPAWAGCAPGSPFGTGHWCSSGWDGKGRGGTQTGDSGTRPGKTRKTNPCLLRVTHRVKPEGSSFHWQWHQKVLWTSRASELSPCPLSWGVAAKSCTNGLPQRPPWLCGVPQVQRLSRAKDTEGLNKARTHLQKQQSKENAKQKTNKKIT